jgi:hypothetical protein
MVPLAYSVTLKLWLVVRPCCRCFNSLIVEKKEVEVEIEIEREMKKI